MESEHLDNLEIGTASPSHYGAALWLATGGRTRHANRGRVTALLAAEKQGRVSFEGLLTATRGNRVVAALWCLQQPGRIATVWGPGLLPNEPDTTAQALVERSVQFARQAGSHLIQSLVGLENPTAGNLLAQSGFRSITQLSHLQANIDEISAEAPRPELRFVRCEDYRAEAFRDLVTATYQDSLDCPELDSIRQTSDVLDGYYATSSQSTQNWYTIHSGEETLGMVILAHHEVTNQVELIYFGLQPKYRRLGLGAEILRFTINVAAFLGCESILTGVDQRNSPAVALYRRFGFQQAEAKELFLLPLKSSSIAVA